MSGVEGIRFTFEQQLRLEADRVLDDIVFQRSPVQSQLLNFLVERAVRELPPPTQYEIAVDGLGRDSDYDLASDSYPRVQISRLRKNLDDYYARNLPGSGLRISLATATYKLKLIPSEASDNSVPIKQTSSENGPVANNAPTLGLIAEAAAPAPTALLTRTSMVLLILLCGAIALAIWLAFDRAAPSPTNVDSTPMPVVALAVSENSGQLDGTLGQRISAISRQIGQIQLRNSFVSVLARDTAMEERADYSLTIDFGQDGRGTPLAMLSLLRPDGSILHANRIEYSEADKLAFTAELEATFIYITSPNGVIAQEEIRQITEPTQSDYACFLSIEGRRSNGQRAASLVDQCLELYPHSNFTAFWYARRAFQSYQATVQAGEVPSRNSEGWSDLMLAFEADEYNAFANFVAAKVELANNRCEDAVSYVSRALDRGATYPTLIAAIETDASACFDQTDNSVFDIDRVRPLAIHNPSPDPLLHIYLMVATVMTDGVEQARPVARRTAIQDPQTVVETTSDLLSRSIQDPAFARANKTAVKRHLRMFVWNPATVDRIAARLTAE